MTFYLWVHIKKAVYVTPLSYNLEEQKNSMTTAVASVTMDMFGWVWDEFYCCDVICAGGKEHI